MKRPEEPEEIEDYQGDSVEDEHEEQMEVTSNKNSYARMAMGKNRSLNLDGISLQYDNKVLIEKAQLILNYQRRYGIVGKNGSGKTSLLRKIYKKQIKSFPPHITTAFCEQEMEGTERSVLDTLLFSDPEIEELRKEESKVQNKLENGEITVTAAQEVFLELNSKLEMKQIHLMETRAEKILEGFGFDEEMRQVKTKSLSGGYRQKLALSKALFLEADILCLDEPTNHLDIENKIFLVNYLLKSFEGTVVVVSHDKAFMDMICTDIIELRKKTLEYFPGNYHDFEVIKEDREKHRKDMYDKQQRKINQCKEKIEKVQEHHNKKMSKSKKKKDVKATVKGVKGHQSKIKRAIYIKPENGKRYRESYDGFRYLLKAEKVDKFKVFKLHECTEEVTGTLLQLNNLSFSHLPSPSNKDFLFRNVNISVNPGDKIAIVGNNGTGKTTLLEIIAEKLQPTNGSVERNRNCKMSFFTQHHIQQLDLGLTPMEHLKNLFPTEKDEYLRAHLAKFGIVEYMPLQKMTSFSGGEKSRVVFATITLSEPNLLLLDEISNHLDMEAQIAIIDALKQFNGAIILVSHDQNLISEVAEKHWVLEDQALEELEIDFEEYIESKYEELEFEDD